MRTTGSRPGGISSQLLRTLEPRPFAGIAYRFIGSRFLQSPLTSAGSTVHGGRFNPPGSFEVLYTALAADTALAEREGILLTNAAIKAAPGVRTGVLLRLDCHLCSVLDLSDEPLRRQLEISLSDLLGPWLPWNVPALSESGANRVHAAPSQLIGQSVYASRRFEAILSPSAKDPAGRCLAILPGRLQPGSRIGIEDPEGTITGALGLARR